MTDSIVFDTPEGISFFQLASLKGALKMECMGMTRRGQSAYAQAKELYGLKGSKQKVLEQMEAMVKEAIG